jgi:hypothetical protein
MLASLIQLFPSPTGSVVPVLIYLAISGVYANASSCAKYAWQMLIYPAISGVFANASSCAKYAWQMPLLGLGHVAMRLTNCCHDFFFEEAITATVRLLMQRSADIKKRFYQVPIDRSHGYLPPVTCDRWLFSICGNKSLQHLPDKLLQQPGTFIIKSPRARRVRP